MFHRNSREKCMRKVTQEQNNKWIHPGTRSKKKIKGRKITPWPLASFLINGKHPVALLKTSQSKRALRSLVERYQVGNPEHNKEFSPS